MLNKFSRRLFSQGKLALPDLKYDLHELEPVFSKETMDLHYNKHHVAYITNYNKFLDQHMQAHEAEDLEDQLRLSKLLAFNGGGHFNHSFFWENLSPKNKNGGVLPNKDSKFGEAMINSFGSMEKFMEKFNTIAAGIQGSGWGWLAIDKATKQLLITETSNQDTLSQKGMIPLMTVDMWEHAFYVDYRNKKPMYLSNIWEIIDWKKVEDRYNNNQ